MTIIKISLQILAAIIEGICINELAGIASLKAEGKRNLDHVQPEAVYVTIRNCFTILCSIGIALSTNSIVQMIFAYSMLLCMDIIIIMDFRHRIIPNKAMLIIILLRMLLTLPTVFGAKGFLPFNRSVLFESLSGFLLLTIIFLVPAAAAGGIGAGDVKLAGTIGFCLGVSSGLTAVIICGLLILLYILSQPYVTASAKLLNISQRIKQTIPLGVALGPASMIVLIFDLNYPISFSNILFLNDMF